MTDPHTGQTICSCQYGTALLNYSRVQGLPEGVYGASAAAYAAGAGQGYVPLGTEGSAFYSPLVSLVDFTDFLEFLFSKYNNSIYISDDISYKMLYEIPEK